MVNNCTNCQSSWIYLDKRRKFYEWMGGGLRGCKFDIQHFSKNFNHFFTRVELHEAEKMNLQIMQSRCNIDAQRMQQIIVAY